MKRSPIFLDTGYFRAILDKDDRFHAVAAAWKSILDRNVRKLFTTTAVLLELGDHFCKPGPFETALPLIQSVLLDPKLIVVEIGKTHLDAALVLRASRRDKDWGVTDCTSFLVMKSFGITEALACDHHFEQAGYRALLREGLPRK
jgi:uncharacterized protein